MNGSRSVILEKKKKNDIDGSNENIKFLMFLFIFDPSLLTILCFYYCVKIKKRKIRMKRRVKNIRRKAFCRLSAR